MSVDEEVLVGRRLEEARLAERRVGPAPSGKYRCSERSQRQLVLERRLARDRVRVAAGSEVVVAADLEPRHAEDRKAVEVLAVEYDVEHGKALRREELRSQGLEPRDRLAKRSRQPRWQAGDVL